MKYFISFKKWLVESWDHQNDFYKFVRQYQDQFENGHQAHGCPEDFVWHFEPNFPLSKIVKNKGEWFAFLDAEEEMWGKEGVQDRYNGLEKVNEPIVLVQVDGNYYIWDGLHRIAVRNRANINSIPAVVGVKKVI